MEIVSKEYYIKLTDQVDKDKLTRKKETIYRDLEKQATEQQHKILGEISILTSPTPISVTGNARYLATGMTGIGNAVPCKKHECFKCEHKLRCVTNDTTIRTKI